MVVGELLTVAHARWGRRPQSRPEVVGDPLLLVGVRLGRLGLLLLLLLLVLRRRLVLLGRLVLVLVWLLGVYPLLRLDYLRLSHNRLLLTSTITYVSLRQSYRVVVPEMLMLFFVSKLCLESVDLLLERHHLLAFNVVVPRLHLPRVLFALSSELLLIPQFVLLG